MEIADVSIIMPNYNHSEYLEQAIRSVLSQSVRPKEFIIVDDCSTDNSLQIMRRIQKEHPWIEVIANEKNIGPLNVVNEAGERAISKYLYFLPADDFVLPGFLEQFAKACEECSDFVLFKNCLEGWYIDTGDKFFSNAGWKDKRGYFSPEEIIQIIGNGGTCISSSPIYRKDAWLEAGKFVVDLGPFADWFCVYVMAARHGLFNCSEVLLVRRFTSDAYGTTMPRSEGLLKIMRLLNTSEYSDVVDFFSRCKTFVSTFEKVFLDVFKKEENLFIECQNCLAAYVKNLFSNVDNDRIPLKDKIKLFNKVLLHGDEKVAIAPANFTAKVVSSLLREELGEDKIVVFDSTFEGDFDGLQCFRYDFMDNFNIGKVIITSMVHRTNIEKKCKEKRMDTKKIFCLFVLKDFLSNVRNSILNNKVFSL